MTLRCIGYLLVGLAAFAAGCGDKKKSSPGELRVCQADEALVAARLDCMSDDNCPCGAHCDLGLCLSACEACEADEICDSFGRCRGSGETALVPSPPVQGRELAVKALVPHVFLDGADGTGTVQMASVASEPSRVRLLARRGAEVQCEGAWTDECELLDVPAGATLSFAVRRLPESDGGEEGRIGTVAIFSAAGSDSVSLELPSQAGAAGPFAGIYEGGALLVRADLSGAAAASTDNNEIGLSAEVRVHLYGTPEAATIVIADTSGMLTSADSLIGTATLSDNDGDGIFEGEASFPVHPYLASGLGDNAPYTVLAETVQAHVRVSAQPRLFQLELVQAYAGMGPNIAPSARWEISAVRAEDLSDSAPAVPADAVLPEAVALTASAPTPWEAVVHAAIPSYASLSTDQKSTRFAFLFGDANMDACYSIDMADAVVRYLGFFPVSRPAYRAGQSVAPFRSLFLEMMRDGSLHEPELNFFGIFSVDSYSPTSYIFDAPLEERVVPCRGSITGGLVTGFGFIAGKWNVAGRSFDTCNALAADTGCELRPVLDPAETRAIAVSGPGVYSRAGDPGPTGADLRVDVTMTWDMECVLAKAPVHCAQGASCFDPVASSAQDSVLSEVFRDEYGPVSGDAYCGGSGRSGALAIDQAVDSAFVGVSEALSDCEADLLDVRASPPLTSGIYGQALRPLFAPATARKCVNPARLLSATILGLEALVDYEDGDPVQAHRGSGTYATRLLSRWLQLHGFVAAERKQGQVTAPLLLGTADQLPSGEQQFDLALGAWDLLFHPRFADRIGRQPGFVFAQSDYRLSLTSTPPPSDVAKALPVNMLETLAWQARLLAALSEEAALQGKPSLSPKLRELMPRAVLAQAFAADMRQRAVASSEPTLWLEDYGRAAEAANSAIATLQKVDDTTRDLEALLGLAKGDVPLYFTAEGADLGPGGRFAAISDFLLGTGPGQAAWAPTLVDNAADLLNDARTAALTQADRDYRAAVSTAEYDTWVDSVRLDYNERLKDYCGPTSASLIDDPLFNARSCAVSASAPECQIDPRGWFQRWTEDDLLGLACMGRTLAGFAEYEMQQFIGACVGANASNPTPNADVLSIVDCEGGSCLRCVANASLDDIKLAIGSFELRDLPVPGRQRELALRDAAATCRRRFPNMRTVVPKPQAVIDNASCLAGALGEAYLDVSASALAVDASRASFSEFQDRYDIAIQSCNQLGASNERKVGLRNSHKSNMTGLIKARATVDGIAAVAAGVKDCAATVSGMGTDTPWSGAISGGAATIACVAGGFESAANVASIGLSAAIETAQLEHDDELLVEEEGTALAICRNDARMELVGMRRAAIDIETANADLARARGNLGGSLQDAQRIWAEGHALLQDIEGGATRPPSGDVWADEGIRAYERTFRLAKRATFLAVRAVEYEFQQSLAEGDAALTAQVPADLQAVLQGLWSTAGTRGIRGSRPTELEVVLSLRDDIMRLSDEDYFPDGMGGLTQVERLRLVLSSEDHAVYGDDGSWLGQSIPFNLLPLGRIGFASRGVPIYATGDCAERLWSVNASVQGTDVMVGTDTTKVRVDLLKNNTFFSQWCGDSPDDSSFQSARVNPTRNLFRDPGQGEVFGTNLGVENQPSQFSRARIQAFIGVDQAELEDPQYANGESSELAARGLFGEYALFIPAELIARQAANGEYTPGLALDRVDDILLRLDYVSVAN